MSAVRGKRLAERSLNGGFGSLGDGEQHATATRRDHVKEVLMAAVRADPTTRTSASPNAPTPTPSRYEKRPVRLRFGLITGFPGDPTPRVWQLCGR